MWPDEEQEPAYGGLTCTSCGTELASSLLSCPSCQALVHAERLKKIAETAGEAERDGDLRAALAEWREAAALLPRQTRQYVVVADRIADLGSRIDAQAASPPMADDADASSGWSMRTTTGAAGTIGLLLWKFKFLTFAILTKGKLLLLGLTKASTFFSMFAALGVYWAAYGLWFGFGLVSSIYLHEMGHVMALARYGVAANAPMFVPGLGAYVRWKQELHDPRQDARVALAGPLWGLLAALLWASFYAPSRLPVFLALAHFGALLNLLNLFPIPPLDGGRIFRTLNRPERWLAVTVLATAWAATEDGLLLLMTIAGAIRTTVDRPCAQSDRGALVQYIALVAMLATLGHSPYFKPL